MKNLMRKRSAVISVAGFGTLFESVAKAMPKVLMLIVNKPLI
jgi:UTP-glucose-1-phosphate uridylyltransferase